jgi:hypothetical protein
MKKDRRQVRKYIFDHFFEYSVARAAERGVWERAVEPQSEQKRGFPDQIL